MPVGFGEKSPEDLEVRCFLEKSLQILAFSVLATLDTEPYFFQAKQCMENECSALTAYPATLNDAQLVPCGFARVHFIV